MKHRISLLVCLPIIVTLLLSLTFASTGKYALLLFGGFRSGQDMGDEPFVEHEMAPMYKTLYEDYDFDHDDIWVLNLVGGSGGYKNYFSPYVDSLAHYSSASVTNFVSALEDINTELQNNDINLVVIFITGHQGGGGDNPSQYSFYDVILEDEDFADSVDTYLLSNGVNEDTRCVYVMGSCSAWGFYYDLRSVTDYLSFAAADDEIGWGTIDGVPPNSYLHYWQKVMHENENIDFDQAFDIAEDSLLEHVTGDDPIKGVYPSGWDDDWCLSGLTPPDDPTSLSVIGYSNPKAYLSWTDNSDNETGFKVYRSVNSGNYTYKATVGSNVTTYNDYSISNEYEYDYKVAAYRTLSGWTSYSDSTNSDDLPLICWIDGPTQLEYKESGRWDARRAGDCGTPSYQWWKSFDEENWTAIGTGSYVIFSMGKVTVYLKLRVSVGGTSVYDYHTVLPGDAKSNSFDNSINAGNLSPLQFSLEENYPNPFNPETKIRFSVPEENHVNLRIYNLKGQIVATLINDTMDAGYHTATFNAESLPSGIYYYKIVAGKFTDIKRMLLIK